MRMPGRPRYSLEEGLEHACEYPPQATVHVPVFHAELTAAVAVFQRRGLTNRWAQKRKAQVDANSALDAERLACFQDLITRFNLTEDFAAGRPSEAVEKSGAKRDADQREGTNTEVKENQKRKRQKQFNKERKERRKAKKQETKMEKAKLGNTE